MTKETMTVHEGLCELKTLGKRIGSSIEAIQAVAVKENKSTKVNGIDMDTFNDTAKTNAQRAEDLIKRFVAIKSAVNQYNATTNIEVAGHTYTVAQAIWLKDYGMDKKEELRNHYVNMLSSMLKKIERENGEKLTQRAENAANANFGSKEKPDTEEYLKFITSYKDRYQLILVDPLNLADKIQELTDEIESFETAIDSALQVANATNTIEIEY